MKSVLSLVVFAGIVILAILVLDALDPPPSGAPPALPTRTGLILPTATRPAASNPVPNPAPIPEGYPGLPQGLAPAPVVDVVDGDTVDVLLDGEEVRLRLIGLNTPETVDPRRPVECFGREASSVAHSLLDGQNVLVETDPSQGIRDRYDRYLAYIWLEDGRLYNLEMIRGGYAHEYTYDSPYKYQDVFKRAQVLAEQTQQGFWAPTTCNGNTEQPADAVTPLPATTPLPQAPASAATPAPQGGTNCDPSYPDVCIPPPPPDLDCGDIPHRGFRVLPPDPHKFDGGFDGTGCEGG